jgi:hypothetical protein
LFVPFIAGNGIFLHFCKEAQVLCHLFLAILLCSSSRDRRAPG